MSSRVLLSGSFAVAVLLAPALARADCGRDLGALMKKRMGEVAVLQSISKAHGGKLDPTAACPHLRSLAAMEGQVIAYMTKNKDWCSIPDDLIAKMGQSRAKTAGFAVKACDFAVKMKKMQEQQQQQASQQPQQVVKLPTGPL